MDMVMGMDLVMVTDMVMGTDMAIGRDMVMDTDLEENDRNGFFLQNVRGFGFCTNFI